MAVTYGFFDSRNGDRKYNADQMSEYFRGIVSGGVFQHLDGGLQVTAGTGLSVNVAAGRAIVQNRWIQNSASLPLSISAASETYGRKDAVVLRLDSSARTVSITVKTGTPAASPAAPSMTRSGGVYEMALAYVNVAAGATSVTVTDKRSDSAVCGWAAVAQAASGEVDQMLNDMKTGFDGVEYPSPVAMVQGCDNVLQNEIDQKANSTYTDTSVSVTMEDSKLILYTDGTVNDTTGGAKYKVSEAIPVNANEYYYIKAYANYKNGFYTIFDQNNTPLKWEYDTVGGSTVKTFEKEIRIPSNGAYLYVSGYNTNVPFVTKRTYDPSGLLTNAISAYHVANVTRQAVDDISSPSEYEETTGTTSTGYIFDDDGIKIAYVDGIIFDAPVTGSSTIKITGSVYGTQAYCVFYLGNEIIGHLNKETSGWHNFEDEVVDVPALADRCAVVGATGMTGVPKIKVVSRYTIGGKWGGIKWAAVGDSLTEHNIRTTMNYHDYIAERTGISVYNMGVSGTGYMRHQEDDIAFYQRILNVPTDSDVVTIFGSGNDLSKTLGEPTDTGTTTICGCINTTIDNLYSVLPTVQLGIITPCPWQSYNPANHDNLMDLYSQAIIQICKNRGIPCLDLYHCSGLRPWEASYRELVYSKDEGNGVHPNELGHKILAPHFEAFLDTLLLS